MKTPVLFSLVLTIHGLAIGSFLLMQGCTTRSGISARANGGAVTARSTAAATASDASATGVTREVRTLSSTASGRNVSAPPVNAVPPVAAAPGASRTSTAYTSTTQRRPMPPRRSRAAGAGAGNRSAVIGGATPSGKAWTPSVATTPPKSVPGPSAETGAARASGSTEGSTVYVIKKGDVLSRIAYKNGVSTKELAEYNNLATPDSIRADQKILIPPHARPRSATGSNVSKVTVSAPAKPRSKNVPAGASTYTVQKGDSLSMIAYRHGTTTSTLRSANQISGDRINIGDVLVIVGATKNPKIAKTSVPVSKPSTTSIKTATTYKPATTITTPRTTLPSINAITSTPSKPRVSGFEKVDVISVPKPNSTRTTPLINSGLGVPPKVTTGAAVSVPSAAISVPSVKPIGSTTVRTPSTTAAVPEKELEQAFEYVVQDGESIDDIARAFIVSVDDVRKLNKLGQSEKIKPGQTLKIPPSIF